MGGGEQKIPYSGEKVLISDWRAVFSEPIKNRQCWNILFSIINCLYLQKNNISKQKGLLNKETSFVWDVIESCDFRLFSVECYKDYGVVF